MIRRNKENRDLLTLRRERMKDLQGKMYRKGTLQNPNVTLEELEKIEKATREKEKPETTILILIFTVACIVVWMSCWLMPIRQVRKYTALSL